MFFEVSARTGTNIAIAFNELAKKLTGIETKPISDLKNTGFTLNAPSNNPNQDGNGGNEPPGKGKKKGKCC